MKRYKHTASIVAAMQPPVNSGTVFYRIRFADFCKAMDNESDINAWFDYAVKEFGFDAFDVAVKLPGAKVIAQTIFICKTDGQPIEVAGEMIDPGEALETVNWIHLRNYISDPSGKEMLKLLTPYELRHLTDQELEAGQESLSRVWDQQRLRQDLQELKQKYKN